MRFVYGFIRCCLYFLAGVLLVAAGAVTERPHHHWQGVVLPIAFALGIVLMAQECKP